MSSKLEQKSKRLVVLGASFFVIGLVFFVADIILKNDSQKKKPEVVENLATSDSALKNYPDPKNFQNFLYDSSSMRPENILTYNGECHDKYITFLIFPKEFDYRNDPTKANVNRAIACPQNGKFEYTIRIDELKIVSGKEYYSFVADQGEKGIWYNPR